MKQRMLVVENNSPRRELLCDWLQAEGFEVSAAEDLERAFAAFTNHSPCAVLLDVQSGPEGGLTLPAWMRTGLRLQTIPVIAVTARATVIDQERVIQSGCNACISRPLDFQLLRERLQHWLTIAKAFQQNVDGEQ
jgi:two-component system cell cycle response regulator DivK